LKYDHHISENDLILIESYITKTLDADARVAFEKELLQNSDLRQKTSEVRLLLLGIQEVELKAKFPEFHQGMSRTGASLALKTSRGNNFSRLAIAASILLFLCLGAWGIWFRQPFHEKLFNHYFLPDPGLATVMSQSPSYDFEKAMVEYKNGQYQAALKKWTALLGQKPGNDTLIYFIGSAQMAMGKYEEAMKNLEGVANNTSSAFSRDADWYLGLYYLRVNDKQKALDYLNKSGYPEATELTDEINKP
jgi:tetratricopeptide (TPR) repeat protein